MPEPVCLMQFFHTLPAQISRDSRLVLRTNRRITDSEFGEGDEAYVVFADSCQALAQHA